MRHSEFWERMEHHLGSGYARAWSTSTHLAALDDKTAADALESGVPSKVVWRAVHAALELPAADR